MICITRLKLRQDTKYTAALGLFFLVYDKLLSFLYPDERLEEPIIQGHPTTIFGKYLFGRRFEIYTFRNICCKISCLPASPRIFENLNNGIIAYF